MHSIVLFRALQLGDMLCAIPAFRAVRVAFPESRITLAGLPWAHALVTRFMHYVDDFVAFPGVPQLPEQPEDVAALPGFFANVRARHYDLAVQVHGSGAQTNAIVAAFGAKRTAGFHPQGEPAPAAGDFFPYPDQGHEIRRLLRLLEVLGIPAQGEELEFPLYDDDYRELDALTGMDALEPGRYVCLHPGARDIAKRWPARHFARIGEALHDIGYRVVLTGSGAERTLTTAIARAMRNPSINCAAPVSVGAIAALLNHARLIVTNDTGVSHIAAALRLPSVVIFSATDPDRWAPLDGTLHRIVRDRGRTDVNGVLRAVQQLLEGTWTPGRDQASVRSALSLSVQRMT